MGRHKLDKITLICKHCGKEFLCMPRFKNKKMFCSRKCRNTNPEQRALNSEAVVKACMLKYGTRSPSSVPSIKAKQKITMLNKYGCEHALQSKHFLEKSKETCLIRYGVNNASSNPEIKARQLASWKLNGSNILEKRKNKFYSSKWAQILAWDHLIPQFNEEEFKRKIFIEPLHFICKDCGRPISSLLQSGYIPSCACSTTRAFRSKMENELIEYIRNELGISNIIPNNRSILHGNELDIYLPDFKLAIEVNGLYWHSENFGGKNRNYHLNKTKLCTATGIHLLHIFDYEWMFKKDIIKSIIRTKVNKISRRIYARKCSIKEISSAESRNFLNVNHLQGYGPAKINLGLFNEDELVSVLSFSKPRFNKTCDYELIRYATKLNSTILGGFEKLFKYFNDMYEYKTIITYSDRRFFTGNIYLKNNFRFIENTPPAYFYFKQFNVYNRIRFQKHKLKKILPVFDPALTEFQNMINNKYDRCWDCGNLKFIYEK